MSKSSDDYEIFVQSVMAALTGVDVEHKAEFFGVRTGRKIITDVSFTIEIAGSELRFVVECKHYSDRVGVDDIEEFRTKLEDLNAHKGIVVTINGFQSGAIQAATAYGIALALITSDQQPNELQYIVKSGNKDVAPVQAEFLCGVVYDGHRSGNPIRFKSGEDLTEIIKWHIIKQIPFNP